jgi:D-alanyl-D-alanine carboxypeptidase/D-alanyl-D-alanine-endopeptidase (penicillin-binding protein 4)
VTVQAAPGNKAAVSLQPRPLGVTVINDVLMGGGCSAWANWRSPEETGGGALQLWVRGRWDASCGKQQIAYVRPPVSVRLCPGRPRRRRRCRRSRRPRWWRRCGPKRAASCAAAWSSRSTPFRRAALAPSLKTPTTPAESTMPPAPQRWASEFATPLPELIREINKTSNNLAARKLLLSLGDALAVSPGAMLRSAQDRVHSWLRSEGLAEGDLRIDIGSGQSRSERGTPRAMVQLLHRAWAGSGSQAFIDSLPIAGVDGTLTNRLRTGSLPARRF